MESKNTHLVSVDLETQQWIEQYSERKNLSIQETFERVLRIGHLALETQEIEIADFIKGDPKVPIRVKIGIQAAVECLSILRKVHLPNLADQKNLAFEVKRLIEETIKQTVNEREDAYS